MKKLFLIFAIGIIFTNAQTSDEEETFDKKNDISVNALDLVAAGTLDIGYERMLKNNQSVAFDVYLFDNYAYDDVNWTDYKSNAFSFKASYIIYFSKTKLYKGFLFYPYLKLRTGSLEFDDEPNLVKTDVGGFQMGFGVGNKWRISNDRISLAIIFELGRELGGNLDEYYYSKVEPRFGVNLGFVF